MDSVEINVKIKKYIKRLDFFREPFAKWMS